MSEGERTDLVVLVEGGVPALRELAGVLAGEGIEATLVPPHDRPASS